MISTIQLGRVDYSTALKLQQTLVKLRKAGQITDTLLLLEHPPVITLGRNAKRANVLVSEDQLARSGVEIFECDRGGDVTYHGPGQLVGYPIFDLRGVTPRIGAVEFVRKLEEVLIRTCADFGVATKRIKGLTGVWTERKANFDAEAAELRSAWTAEGGRPHASMEAKIAALGVHISRGVTSHGFALNVNTDLSFFDLIVPCGITSKPVTSLEKETGNAIALQEVAHSVSCNFGVVFGSQMLWLESLDELLGHNVGVPMRVPAELKLLHNKDENTWA